VEKVNCVIETGITVSEEANSQLEGPLTIQELQTALQGMQGRRAPGIDGLSVEFYKAYWDVLSHDLLDVFNESLASGSMPVSCRRAVITLLPKKGNLQDIKNWRPVSLLCVDYKILSKALATRLGKAVEQVIHRDQTYCVPADQEKAFDRVEHSFLWKVMEKFGFSAGFIAKIKQLVDAVGPELSDAQALGSLLGLHSVRVAQRILQLWSQILCPEEKRLLRSYGQGRARPDPADPFPEIYLSPGLGELTGPLLQVEKANCVIETGITVRELFVQVQPLMLPATKITLLDISNSGTPGLTVALCRTKTLCLQQLVDAVGPELSDAQALGSLLGLHSVRVAQRILQLWSQILCPEEKGLLRSYGQGGARPDPADPFPEIYLSPGLGELTAPLLQVAPCSRGEGGGTKQAPFLLGHGGGGGAGGDEVRWSDWTGPAPDSEG
ncbi:hypothetical protein NHX12_014878, partial [Muraenolepis orangiensis]